MILDWPTPTAIPWKRLSMRWLIWHLEAKSWKHDRRVWKAWIWIPHWGTSMKACDAPSMHRRVQVFVDLSCEASCKMAQRLINYLDKWLLCCRNTAEEYFTCLDIEKELNKAGVGSGSSGKNQDGGAKSAQLHKPGLDSSQGAGICKKKILEHTQLMISLNTQSYTRALTLTHAQTHIYWHSGRGTHAPTCRRVHTGVKCTWRVTRHSHISNSIVSFAVLHQFADFKDPPQNGPYDVPVSLCFAPPVWLRFAP